MSSPETTPAAPDPSSSRRQHGAEVLGPFFAWYLLELHTRLLVLAERGVPSLFVARAGVRIAKMYETFCEAVRIEPACDTTVLWTSRMMLAKGVLRTESDAAHELVEQSFPEETVAEVIAALMRHEPEELATLDLTGAPFDRPATEFASTLDHPSLEPVLHYLEAYEGRIRAQFAGVGVEPGGEVALIDSGWQGTIHRLVEECLPDVDVTSLYLGVGEFDEGASLPPGVVELVCRVDRYDPARPETALTFYRHLIEGVLEPTSQSAESLSEDSSGTVTCPQAREDEPQSRNSPGDQLFLGVLDHLQGLVGYRPWVLAQSYEASTRRLAELITHPKSLEEVELLSVASRSADFGRDFSVSIPMPAEKRHDFDTAATRISESLWPQAQALFELRSDEIQPTFRALSGESADIYFTPLDQHRRAGTHGRVQIITRTKDRNILLRRAADSVANQTYTDYEWIVVNDGGDHGAVVHTLRNSPADLSRTTLVSNQKSVGMEAASNLGVRATAGDYVVIHDDDDSWEPEFLAQTIEFLESTPGQRYGGVVSSCTLVRERIDGGTVEIVETEPYNPWVRSIDIAEMMAGNLYAPIAFVYRRSEYDRCGGYDETLPVLGDWDFNLRFLEEADIAVLPTPLANYHHRVEGSSVAYSNSVTGGRNTHVEYQAILLNRYLREGLGEGRSSMAYMGVTLNRLRTEFRRAAALLPGSDGTAGSESSELAWAADARWLALSWLLTAPESPLDEQLKVTAGDTAGLERTVAKLTDNALGSETFLRSLTVPRDFDEQDYLLKSPDVKDAVAAGGFSSGFEHFVRFGRAENRQRPT